MEKKKISVWAGAIVVALISIVYGLCMHFMHQDDNKALGLVGSLIFIVAICIICIQFSKTQNGNVTFGNVFAYGFKTSAAVALIMVVWTFVMFKVIFPDFQEEQIQKQIAAMAKKGMSQDQIDKATEISRKYFTIFVIGGTIMIYAIMGVIASLIGAAAAKKNPQANNPFQQ